MSPPRVATKEFEFYFPDLDNSVLVESHEEGVIIRATRNNFSEQRKNSFIRRLAAEGYIPDAYQWSSEGIGGRRGIKWVIDRTWLRIDPRFTKRSADFMKRLFFACTLVWFLLMTWAFIWHG